MKAKCTFKVRKQQMEKGANAMKPYGVKRFTFLFLLILNLNGSFHFGNAQTLWSSNIGENGDEMIAHSIVTQEGTLISIGTTNSFSGSKDLYLIKQDLNGNLLWTKTIGGDQNDEGYSIIETRDGSLLLVGKTYSFGVSESDLYVVKLSSQGEILWSRTIGGPGEDAAYSVCELPNATYLVVGTVYSLNTNSPDLFVVNLDSTGTILWKKSYGTTGIEEGRDVVVTPDNNVVILGYSDATLSGSFSILLLKIDFKGNIIWNQVLGTSGNEKGYRIQMDQNGDFILCGSHYANGQYDGLLIRCDSTGKVQYALTIGNGNDDELMSVSLSSNGDAYATGYTTVGNYSKNILYVKVDPAGNVIYALHYGGAGDEIGYFIYPQEQDGTILIGGSSSSFGALGVDAHSICSQENGTICYTNNFGPVNFVSTSLTLASSVLNFVTSSNYSFAEGAYIAEVPSGIIYNCVLGFEFSQIDLHEDLNGIWLKWSCSDANSIQYFVIEKRTQNAHFDSIGIIYASESGNQINQYAYYDEFKEPPQPTYYRIKAVTYDNQIFYSPIQVYNPTEKASFFIQYNPFFEKVNIVSNNKCIQEIEILNINGVTIKKLKVNDYQYQAQLNHLATGIYFLKIILPGEEKIIRMISVD